MKKPKGYCRSCKITPEGHTVRRTVTYLPGIEMCEDGKVCCFYERYEATELFEPEPCKPIKRKRK